VWVARSPYDDLTKPLSKGAAMPPRLSEKQIVELIDAFYAKVRRHEILGPVFARAIAPDAWPAHLATMVDFWSSVMLTSGRYKGNPLAAHAKVAALEAPMFALWLALFRATTEEIFPPDVAAVFRLKSERIAESLKLGLFFRPVPASR
jgi:hemoglobin